jgi:hypothetical protein
MLRQLASSPLMRRLCLTALDQVRFKPLVKFPTHLIRRV